MKEQFKKVLDMLKLSKEETVVESTKVDETVKLAEEVLDNGTKIVAEEFINGNSVFIKSDDEESDDVPLPIGEYTLENGDKLVVEVEGEIASINKPEESDDSEDTKQDGEEDLAEDTSNDEGAEKGSDSEKIAVLQKEVADLHDMMNQLLSALEGDSKGEGKEEELSSEEKLSAETETSFSPEAKVKKSKGIRFPKNNNNTTQGRVWNRINK